MNLEKFFRKKIIVEYEDSILTEKDAQEMFATIPLNFPKYFPLIPRTQVDPFLNKVIPSRKTIKTCAGFINLYKRSILVKSPFDIYLEFGDDEIVLQHVGQISNRSFAVIHPNSQLLDYVGTKKYKYLVKILLPVALDSEISLFMSESSYHFNKFNVMPGIINSNYKRDLTFFIPIENDTKDLYIKKGDPLFLLTPLCENKIKINYKILKHLKPNLTFSTLKKYLMDKLI